MGYRLQIPRIDIIFFFLFAIKKRVFLCLTLFGALFALLCGPKLRRSSALSSFSSFSMAVILFFFVYFVFYLHPFSFWSIFTNLPPDGDARIDVDVMFCFQ